MSNRVLDIELLDEVRGFLPRLIDACDTVADQFYVPVTDGTWESFGEVMQGMDDLYRTLQTIVGSLPANQTALRSVIEVFLPAMASKFAEMNRYSDEENYVAAGDVIKHELSSLFRQLAASLGESEDVRSRRFAGNLAFLKERFPDVHEQVKAAVLVPESYQVTYAKNGASNLVKYVNETISVSLYSTYNPQYEAKKWVDSVASAVAGKTDIVIYGFGFGYHLAALTEEYRAHQCYVYEPDLQIFVAAMYSVDLQSILARDNVRHLAVGGDKETIERFFYRFLRFMKGETATLSLPAYDRINVDHKQSFVDYASTAVMNYAFSQSLLEHVGMQWVTNIMNNMAVNLDTPSIKGLKGKFDGATAVIVGAGPSLEADIEHLKVMKDHAIIIAAGTSVQSLFHFGIKPHLIVSMDGGEPNYLAFNHLDTEDIPFLYAPQLEYRIIENKTRNLMHTFFSNDIITQVMLGVTHDDPVFASTHSVTGTAIQAAVYMGCKQVVFTGQDLSYPTDSAYAPGAKHVPANYDDNMKSIATLNVENVQGGVNRTTDGMLLTLKDIEDLLEKHPGVRFINCSRLGAKINHTVFKPLDHVLNGIKAQILDSEFFENAMAQHLKPHDEVRIKTAASRVSECLDLLQTMDEKLTGIQRQLGKLPQLSRGNPLKCLNAMVSIEQEWEPIVKSIMFQTLFIIGLMGEVNKFDRDVSDIAKENDVVRKADLFCKILGPLVNAMRDRIPTFKEIVAEADRRIEQRVGKSVSGVAN